MNGINLRQLAKTHGTRWLAKKLTEGIKLGRKGDADGFGIKDFSLKECAIAFCGEAWYRRLDPSNGPRGPGYHSAQALLEAGGGDAVDVTAFSNITGQILFNKILEGWEQAGMIGEQLVQTIDTKLDGEKLPWISRIIGAGGASAGAYGPGEGEPIHPGMPYPEANLAEQYLTTPSTMKWGEILSITKEAIFFDRTGQLLMRAGEIGTRLRYNKEKRILDYVVGAVNTFNWKGTTYNTYLSGGTYWSNVLTSTPLVDWTSVQAAEMLFSLMTDPDTTNPIVVLPDTLLVMPARLHTARRIISATENRTTGTVTSPFQNQTLAGNTLNPYKILSSPILRQRSINMGVAAANVDDHWWLGQFTKAFAYMRNWDVTVVQAPANATADFERDIVTRYKASERGTPAVIDPRYVAQMTGSTAGDSGTASSLGI